MKLKLGTKIDIMRNCHQKDYVEFLLENAFLINDHKNYYTNLRLLTAYLKEVKGLKPKQRENYIYNFLQEYDEGYNKATDYKRIDKALKDGSESNLRDFDLPFVYRAEFDFFDNLPLGEEQKRLLFSSYCFYKLRNQIYPNYKDNIYISSKIATLSQLKKASALKKDAVYYLNELKDVYLDWCPARDTSVVLLFLDKMQEPRERGDKIQITDFNSLWLYYEFFKGNPNICFCEKCGSIFKNRNHGKKGRSQKYCSNCLTPDFEYPYKKITCKNCGKIKYISILSRRKEEVCNSCYQVVRRQDRHISTSSKK